MIRKNLSPFLLLPALLVLSLVIFQADVAKAQGVSPKDDSCIDCHLEQYWLFDKGRYYCLCITPVRCSECHGGVAGVNVQETAHQGLIANPLANDARVCQGCHLEDVQERVEKFGCTAGIVSTPRPYATLTPSPLISQPWEAGGGGPLRSLPPGGWQVLGFGFLGAGLLLLFVFTCRCWRADHPESSGTQQQV
jgi:hypothetical protein